MANKKFTELNNTFNIEAEPLSSQIEKVEESPYKKWINPWPILKRIMFLFAPQ